MTMRVKGYRLARVCAVGAPLLLGGAGAAWAQHFDARALGEGMELFQVRANFYVLTGAGGNVALQVGSDGAVVVDAGDAAHAERLAGELKKLAPRPIVYVINTSGDADHVGGNEAVAKAGQSLLDADPFSGRSANDGAASILAAEGVLLRLSAAQSAEGALPSEAFAQRRKYLYLNDEGIEVIHQPAAHTDGDSVVFFRRSDVVMAGDIIDMRRFPVIDLEHGGSIKGEIAALNRIIELAIPSVPIVSREAGTVVVPGHGRLLDQTDVVEYRDMVVVMRDRIADLRSQGKTLAQVKAANPGLGYAERYGSATGSWTTDMFIEAVFKSLAAEEAAGGAQ